MVKSPPSASNSILFEDTSKASRCFWLTVSVFCSLPQVMMIAALRSSYVLLGWVVIVSVTSPASPCVGCTLIQSAARVMALASAVHAAEAVKRKAVVPPACSITGAVFSVSGMTIAGWSGSGTGSGVSFPSSSLQAVSHIIGSANKKRKTRNPLCLLNLVNNGGGKS